MIEYEYVEKQEDVRNHIKNCEGRHTQQAIYSTFHDALTQLCFGCKKIRSNIYLPEKEVEEMPGFEGTREDLDKISIR